MDVSTWKSYTGIKIAPTYCLPVSGVSNKPLAVFSLFTKTLVFMLFVYGATAVVNAAQSIPPMPKSDWEYFSVRCSARQGPFETELEAATTGMNRTYGSCGNQYVYDWGRWGTLQEKVSGACGSTNYHPRIPNDFAGDVEVYNNRKLIIYYCTFTDGLSLIRERTAGCPAGYSGDGSGGCKLSGINLLKTAGPACPAAGNPVSPGSGNKYQREVDSPVSAMGSASFVRHYNSRVGYAGLVRAIRTGNGWSNTYTRQVNYFRHRGISVATVLRPEGRAYYFTLDATSNTWVADEDIESRLEEMTDSAGVRTGWRYRTSDDVAELYNADGLLQSITDLQGKTRTLTYEPQDSDYPARVDSNTGEHLKFTYNSKNRLASMEDHAGRIWGYRYDNNDNLEFVDNPDLTTRQYHYEDVNYPDALTGVTDERGLRYSTFEYNESGQATASYHGPRTTILTDRIEGVSIVYNADGTRALTNSNGNVSNYTTLTRIGVMLVTDISGPGCTSCGAGNTSYDYDPENNNLRSRTENGVTTEYGDYDSNGNPGYRIEAKDTTEERRTDYTYDPRYNSKVLTITGPSVFSGSSKVMTYVYDDYGNRISETIDGYTLSGVPVSRTTTREYNGPLQQLSSVDGPRTDISDVTRFRYYENDALEGSNRARLREVEDATGTLIQSNIQYTSTGKVSSETRPNVLNVTYSYYPGNDRLETMRETSSEGEHVTRWTYIPTGEVQTITLASGTQAALTIALQYDDARRLTRITDGLGNYIEYILDTEGNRLAENIYDGTSVLKNALTRTFDMYNRMDVNNQANESVDFDYAPGGTLVQQTNGEGTVTTFSYDGLKRLLASTRDLGGVGALLQYSYDETDNVTSVTDPVNGSTFYQYDDLGNLVQLASPDTGTTIYTYDAAGNLASRQEASGNIIVYSYDELNRLTSVDAPGVADDISYAYDTCANGAGQLCSILSGESLVTYAYDAFANVTFHQQIAYNHDMVNRVRTVTYPSGAIVSYIYNVAGQVGQVNLEADGSVTALASNISYVPFGPLENLSFGNGTTLVQTFDSAYRNTSQQIPDVLDIGYLLYDANGNLETRSDSISGTDSFGYDTLNRLNTGSGSFGIREYDYDLNGNRVTLYNGSTINYGFSPGSNRLLNASGWTYFLDANGNTTEKINTDGDGQLYDYNNHNHLVTVSGRTTTPVKGKNKPPVVADTVVGSYIYNGLGQRANKDAGEVGTQFLYGTGGALMAELDGAGKVRREYIYLNNQLLAVLDHRSSDTGGSEDVIIDNSSAPAGWTTHTSKKDYGSNHLYSKGGSGNPVRWTPSLGAGDYEVYVWYVKNRKYSNNVLYAVSHNGESDIIAVDHSAHGCGWLLLGTYTFDGSGDEYVEVSDITGKTTADAVRFVNVGGPASTVTKLSYVHNDHLGTPQVMTDEAGSVVWRATYDPFGAATIDSSSTVEMNIRFPGQYYDSETGLHYNYFRYYDPEIGRYITSDPVGLLGGANTFTYAANNPVIAIDPTGLVKLYGSWCGPDWSGGIRKSFDELDAIERKVTLEPIDNLDRCCQTHDITYAVCREKYPCDREVRKQCFKQADRRLSNCSTGAGGGQSSMILLFGNPQRRIEDYMKGSNPDGGANTRNCGCK